MTDFIRSYIGQQYLLIGVLVSIALIVRLSLNMTGREFRQLYILFFIVFLQSLYGFADSTIATLDKEGIYVLHYLFSTFCHVLHPITVALFGNVVIKSEKRRMYLYFSPLVVNLVVYMISLANGCAYYITKGNVFVRGPLFQFSNIICALYLLIIAVYSVKNTWNKSFIDKLIVVAVIIELLMGITIDMLNSENEMSLALVMALMTYLLYIYVSRNNERLREKEEELEQKKNELMMSQIQPHFIYNTLNVIYRLCQVDPPMAGETIVEFSNYLRNNLETAVEGRKLVEFSKEILHTKFYSDIEQLRFPHLEVVYDIEDEDYLIPPLTIQPMVENAVRHGVRGMKNGRVQIKSYKDEKYHIIEVVDNGRGKPTEEKRLGEHKGIGIKNVTDRIESFCGGTLDINMEEGVGTVVTIKIPINDGIKDW